MAAPKIDKDKAIRALVDAAVMGDRKACEVHGISDRTLRNYRVRFENDDQLAEAFRGKNEQADRTWMARRRAVLSSGIRKLGELIENAGPKDINAVAGAVKVLGELEITQEALGGSGSDQPSPLAGEAQGRAGAPPSTA